MTTPTSKAAKRTACKSCGKPILWALGPGQPGRWMPVDADEVLGGNLRVYLEPHTGRLRWAHEIPAADRLAYGAHWRTCPKADEHRRRAPAKNATEAPPERPQREQIEMFGGGGQRPRPLHADDGGKP